ncbi:MAG: class I tRNA ligase family protein, partial [Nitrospirae bacterium]|nr:class I tRNA ligase family protein [Nitrospirota bacterium]
AMTRLMAPVLSFTSEEIWGYLKQGPSGEETVHLSGFPDVDPACLDEDLAQRWEQLLKVRGEIFKALEIVRKTPKSLNGRDWLMGHSLEACVEIYGSGDLHTFLKNYEKDLPALWIVSGARLAEGNAPDGSYISEEIEGLRVNVLPAPGGKCERCWNYSTYVGQDSDHLTLCKRCTEVVKTR